MTKNARNSINRQMLHVFRNTPFGRETLLQSIHYCQQASLELSVYIPTRPQFLMYFDNAISTVDLDRSYVRAPETAAEHAEEILAGSGVPHQIFEPTDFTAPTLPEVPTNFSVMCCPRSISNVSTRIGLGYIGPRVRQIAQNAAFPVLLPSAVFKPWRRVACFFGGSAHGQRAVRYALWLGRTADAEVRIFTQPERRPRVDMRAALEVTGADPATWTLFDPGDLRENLYAVPHDALVVVGAYGQGLTRELLFGSKVEVIQTVLPNPIVIVGPRCDPEVLTVS
ncbi:MAG: universal stress protein [Acidobacteriota bacterium]